MASDQIRLSRVERTILINQYEILARLDPNNADTYEQQIDILRWGFASLYDQVLFQGDVEGLSEDEGRYVMDVLDMYAMLQAGAEKAGLEDKRVKFPGFDGNNEGLHLLFAQHLRRAARWAHVDAWSKDLNSHMRTRRKYESMLSAYRPIFERAVDKGTFEPLTADEVLLVLDAGQSSDD